MAAKDLLGKNVRGNFSNIIYIRDTSSYLERLFKFGFGEQSCPGTRSHDDLGQANLQFLTHVVMLVCLGNKYSMKLLPASAYCFTTLPPPFPRPNVGAERSGWTLLKYHGINDSHKMNSESEHAFESRGLACLPRKDYNKNLSLKFCWHLSTLSLG